MNLKPEQGSKKEEKEYSKSYCIHDKGLPCETH
jgi:hypothetical protein